MSVTGGSSFGGSAAGSLAQGANFEDREIASTSTFWHGCFGMLHTVNKDRKSSVLFFSFKYLMEFLQLTLLMLGVQYGWQFDASNKGWQFVEFIQVRPFMATIGHALFIVVFVAFVLGLLTCVGIYIWVFWCFQNNKFDYTWPLRIVRVFGAAFFEIADVMAMSLLLTAIDCRYYGWPSDVLLHSLEFPTVACMSMPNLIYYFVALIAFMTFVVLYGFNKLAQMNLNPATRNLDSYAHPAVELWVVTAKIVMVLAGVFLGDYRHLAVVWLISSIVLLFFFWKWEPMVVPWVNYVRAGTFAAVLYVSCVFMALQFPPDSIKDARDYGPLSPNYQPYANYVKILEIALAGAVPAALVGALAAYLRLRRFRVTLLNKFKEAAPGVKARTIHKFDSPREVEIVVRCCRVWVDADTLQPEAVALAQRVLKSGLVSLPHSPLMVVWYTSFLVDVQGSFQSGFTQLQMACKMDPSFIERYAIFVREQDRSQKTAGGLSNVMSNVEFQKNYRLAMRAHKDALEALRNFWALLQHAQVSFESLAKATRQIDDAIRVAERTYRSVLHHHSDQARLIRLYAKFLENVKHDPWGAARWTAEAEKLELTRNDTRQTNVLGMDEQGGDISAGHVSRFSVGEDGEERALCVFNANGMISMTNEAMRSISGYGQVELKDKSVALLMPPLFAEQAIALVKTFVHVGRGSVVLRAADCVAVHKDRHMFGARVKIVRISGIGEDSMFLASLEVMPVDPDEAMLWVLPNGHVLSADSNFCDWFGYSPADFESMQTSALTTNVKEVQGVLKSARQSILLSGANGSAEAAAADDDDACGAAESMALLSEGSSAGDKVEAIAQALAMASTPLPTSINSTGQVAEWSLQGVGIYHKFADVCEVDMTVVNSKSKTFPMHVVTLRRTGPAAAKPPQHMIVTNPSGNILHATDSFATLLGTTARGLIANGSNTALEALMVQPFGLIHRAGLATALPSTQAPAYSCRSGLSVLMPVANSRLPTAVPVKMQMKKRTNLDDVVFVCAMQPTSWEQALDERSLRLVLNEQGIVQSVGASPVTLFDVHPSTLVGRTAASYINVFDAAPDAALLLSNLAAYASDAPGSTWRVAVGTANFHDLDGIVPAASKGLALAKQAKAYAAVMSVTSIPIESGPKAPATLELDEQDAALLDKPWFEVRLWRADMVTSIIEVDGNGTVVDGEGYLQTLYPAGNALGMGLNQMLGEHIRDFLPLGERKYTELFDEGAFPPVPVKGSAAVAGKKSNIKPMNAGESRRVGAPVLLHGRNRLDGQDLDLTVQIVRKGQGAYLVVHPYNAAAGRLDLHEHINQVVLCPPDFDAPPKERKPAELEGQRSIGRKSAYSIAAMSSAKQQPPPGVPIKTNPSIGRLISGLLMHDDVEAAQRPSAAQNATPLASQGQLSLDGGGVRFSDGKELSPGGDGGPSHAVGKETDDVSTWVNSSAEDYPSPGKAGNNNMSGKRMSRNNSLDPYNDDLEESLHHDSSLDRSNNGDDDDVDDGYKQLDSKRSGGGGGKGGGGGGYSSRHGDNNNNGDNDSQLDEAFNATDDEASYRRGQRLKKLNRIFNSEAIKKHTSRFKWHTVGVMVTLAVAAIVVFAVMNKLVSQQIRCVEDLNNMGIAARSMMKAVVSTLDMGQMYTKWPNTFLVPTLPGLSNDVGDLQKLRAIVSQSNDEMVTNMLGTYEGFDVKRRLPEAYGLRRLWEQPVLIETNTLNAPAVLNDPNNLLPQVVPINGTTTVLTVYGIKQNISMFDALEKLAAKLRTIIVNGAGVNSSVAANRRWLDWDMIFYLRLNVDNTFLPAFITTMDGYAQVVVDQAADLNQVQLIMLIIEGCVLAGGVLAYMWYLVNRVDTNRYRIYCVFMSVPLAMVRTLANARTSIGVDDDSDDDTGATVALINGGDQHYEGDAVVATGGGKSSGGGGKAMQINIAGATFKYDDAPRTFWSKLGGCLMFWKQTRVAPTEKRKLTRSVRGVLWLIWPFAVWGLVVILINALSHANLGTVNEPMMTFNIVNCVQCKIWRLFYQTTMLHYLTNQTTGAVGLANRLKDAQNDYNCMLYGRAGVPDQNSTHYTLVTKGIANQPGPGQFILYDTTECLAENPTDCLPVTDSYGHYTLHGLDTLVQRVFNIVTEMIEVLKRGGAVINTSVSMQFMWKIRQSLAGGALKLVVAYKGQVQNVYRSTILLQTIALIITLVMVVWYLFFMLRPYLAQVAAERRRITELLTQLPVDIDVENLVMRAVLGKVDKPAPSPAAASASSHAALLASAGGNDGGGGGKGGGRQDRNGGNSVQIDSARAFHTTLTPLALQAAETSRSKLVVKRESFGKGDLPSSPSRLSLASGNDHTPFLRDARPSST